MTDDPILLSRKEERVQRLTLNRLKARNSLSLELMEALKQAIIVSGKDEEVGVVLLEGNGPAFCAGHDLRELKAHHSDSDGGKAYYEETFKLCAELMQAIIACPKPVIAVVRGIATAAGCQLVASCDLALAEEEARFATPGVNIGLFCSTPMVALSRNVPKKQAMEMLLTGDLIAAKRAAEIGLINNTHPTDVLEQEVLALATKIASKSPLTLSIGKSAFYKQAELSLPEAYAYTAEIMTQNMLALDAQEGIDAFLEKRHPTWRGR